MKNTLLKYWRKADLLSVAVAVCFFMTSGCGGVIVSTKVVGVDDIGRITPENTIRSVYLPRGDAVVFDSCGGEMDVARWTIHGTRIDGSQTSVPIDNVVAFTYTANTGDWEKDVVFGMGLVSVTATAATLVLFALYSGVR